MKNFLYLFLIISFAASADFFFVDNVEDFRQTLIEVTNNSKHDTINVAPGHYDVSGGTLLYAPGSGGDFGDDDSGLTIWGINPSSTILDGMNLVTPLTIRFIATDFAGSIVISGLAFRNGKGENGGGLSMTKGIYTEGGNVMITNSHFIQNLADQNGGGAYFDAGGVTLIDNRFVENKTGEDGGGYFVSSYSNSEVTNNEFSLNQAGKSGGGAYSNGNSNNLMDNRFVENKAGGSGGGLYCLHKVEGNCNITRNEFSLNQAGGSGGGANLSSGGSLVTANRFHNNRAGGSGGGLIAYGEFGVWVNSNIFIGNRAESGGGGSYVESQHDSVRFYNNVLGNNWAGQQGGGVYLSVPSSDLINNTLTNNESGTEGGGAYVYDYSDGSTFSNNIIWKNKASAGGNDLYANNSYRVSLFNNNLGQNANFETANSPDLVIIDTTDYSQGDNIKSNPLLTDDFHLQYGSPAIDAGDNTAVQGRRPIDMDFEGDPRVINGNSGGEPIVDIGADENARADINKDGCVDRTDADIILHNLRANSDDPEDDINEDGTVNRADARVMVRLFTGGTPCKLVALDYAKRAGGTGIDNGLGIAVDTAGNSVVTGGFSDTATFGAGEPNETVLTNGGMFVAKYASNGSLVWATQAGGIGRGIAVDTAGNNVVTGGFSDTATFGAGEPNETVLTNGGMFVAKYAPNGSLVWATQAGGESGNGITVDAAGNSIVIGTFLGNATFGTGEPNETVLTSAGRQDIFVAKYAPDGSLIWATRAGGMKPVLGLGIAVDTAGNIAVTGYFSSTAIFGAGEPNVTVLTSVDSADIFVAQYAPDGSLLWAKQAGGTGTEISKGIAVDAAGNSVVTGFLVTSAKFGAGEPNETVLTGPSIFVAKYSSKGSLIWAMQAFSSGSLPDTKIAVDTTGNILVTGGFIDTATFGAGEPNETVLTSAGRQDIFVAKYAPDGSLIWATRAGGMISSDAGKGIAVDATGNSVVTGFFYKIATFGADEPNETMLTSAGREDIFVAKFNSIP
jgi:hypothetical protein